MLWKCGDDIVNMSVAFFIARLPGLSILKKALLPDALH